MRKHKVFYVWLLFMAFGWRSASLVFAAPVIFDLQHRRAADVAEPVREALGAEARVTAVKRSLVVDADPESLQIAAELIARLDQPLQMLRISVAQQQSGGGTQVYGGLSGEGSYGSTTVVVGRQRPPTRGGGTVIVGNDDYLRIDGQVTEYRGTYSAEHFVVTLEGSPARIEVGKRIPVTEQWITLARRYARVTESVRYESITSGFEVEPELSGDNLVHLSIRPYLSFQNPLHPCEVRFQDLTTRVKVSLGQWFDIGGAMISRDEVSRQILAAGANTTGEGGGVRIKVDLQPN